MDLSACSDAPTENAVRQQPHLAMHRITSTVSAMTAPSFQELIDFTSVAVLCGREHQEEALREAYKRISTNGAPSEVVLVHGISGTGKSSLVDSMRDMVTMNNGGYFVSGKFDQLITRNEPFSAIAGAFSDVCDLILQNNQDDDRRRAISEALGSDSRILSRVVSSISALITGHDDSHDSSVTIDTESFTPFRLVCGKFLRATATKEHPLCIFLDDLQWADEMSVRLIKSFITDSGSQNLLLCVAYRDDEVDGKTLLGLDNADSIVNSNKGSSGYRMPCTDIEVTNLRTQEISSMLAQQLHLGQDSIGALASVLWTKTMGNPNALVQLLQYLKEKQLLTFSDKTYSWDWDMSAIESEVSDNPTEIIAEKIGRLSTEAQEALQLAAFLGNTFHVEWLQLIVQIEGQETNSITPPNDAADNDAANVSTMAQYLQNPVRDGLIKDIGNGLYTFIHDSIQHYLYNSVENESERELIHLRIGRKLVTFAAGSSSKATGEQMTFLAASNMVRGANQIVSYADRIATMQLFLDAATLAVSKISVIDARKYLECAVKIMRRSDYETNHALCIDLQNTYAEVSSCTGSFTECYLAVDSVLKDANLDEDRFRANRTKIRALLSQKENAQMLDWTFNVVLNDLGEKIPTHPTPAHILVEMIRVKVALRKISPQDFLAMPKMTNAQKLRAMQLFVILQPVLFSFADKGLYLCCTLRQIRMSVKYGICATTSLSLLGYAITLYMMKRVDEAYELGRVSIEMSSWEGHSDFARSECLGGAYLFVFPIRDPLANLVQPMFAGYKLGLSCGSDVSAAFYGLFGYLGARNELGVPIMEFEDELRRYCRQMRDLQANQMLFYVTIMWQYALNLLGRSDDPLVLTGEAMDEQEYLTSFECGNDGLGLNTLHSSRLRLQISFEDWDSVAQTLPLALKSIGSAAGFNAFFCSTDIILASLALYGLTRERKYKRVARRTRKTMIKWSKAGVPTVKPLMALVDAEWKAIVQNDATREDFETAIRGLKMNDFAAYEMIAYQRAMRLMLERSDIRKAGEYLTRSLERHKQWGNSAKVQWLEDTYVGVLTRVKPAFIVEVMRASPTEEELCLMNMH